MIRLCMSVRQGLTANQLNVALVIQRVPGKVSGQTADDKPTDQGAALGRKHSPAPSILW